MIGPGRNWIHDPALISGWAVGAVLIAAGAGKLLTIGEFQKLLKAYEILPPRVVSPASILLPVCELILGACVVFHRFEPASGLAGAGLFMTFAAGMAVNLLRGRSELPCGCFGRPGRRISWRLVVRNSTLAGIAVASSEGWGPLAIALLAALTVEAFLRRARGNARGAAHVAATAPH